MTLVHFGTILSIAVAIHTGPLRAQAAAPSATRAVGPLADSLRVFALQMGDLLRNRDAAGTLRLYGDTSHFVHVDNGEAIPWSQLSAMIKKYFATATSNPVAIVGEPGVAIADQDNAVLYVTHRFDATGDRPAHSGVWTGVLHRFPQGWKIVHSHSSDKRPSH